MQQVVTLTGFETKTGSNDSGGWTLYLFSSAGGAKYQTFDDDLGKAGLALVGQSADIEYDVEEKELPAKGQYPARTVQNNVIRSIKAAGSDPTSQTGIIAPTGQTFTTDPRTITEPERQLRIMRQSALDRAISTAATHGAIDDPIELFALADTYIKYFEQGAAAFTPEKAKF